jgi:hypothetical protein
MTIILENDKDYHELFDTMWSQVSRIQRNSKSTFPLSENNFYRAAREAIIDYIRVALQSPDENANEWAKEQMDRISVKIEMKFPEVATN